MSTNGRNQGARSTSSPQPTDEEALSAINEEALSALMAPVGLVFGCAHAISGVPFDGPLAYLSTAVRLVGVLMLVKNLSTWWTGFGATTQWGKGLVALAKQEPLVTPGELAGNLCGAVLVYLTFGASFDPHTGGGVFALAALNLLRLAAAYGLAYLLFFRLRLLHADKFTPEYAGSERLRDELRHWLSSAMVGTAVDLALRRAFALGVPEGGDWGLLGPLPALSAAPLSAAELVVVPFLILWTDLHFYCVHRTLHTPLLYRHIHSVHHKSRNPNPISGLSFHPVEAICYYSALPFAMFGFALVSVTAHPFHYAVVKAVLDFNPIWGHTGVGGAFGGNHHHYLHHTIGYKLHINFGGTWLFDGLFGTGHVEPRPTPARRRPPHCPVEAKKAL